VLFKLFVDFLSLGKEQHLFEMGIVILSIGNCNTSVSECVAFGLFECSAVTMMYLFVLWAVADTER